MCLIQIWVFPDLIIDWQKLQQCKKFSFFWFFAVLYFEDGAVLLIHSKLNHLTCFLITECWRVQPTVCLRRVGTYQLFQKWNFRDVPPTHDRMRRSCAALLLLCWNTFLITCSNVPMMFHLGDTRQDPILWHHEIMRQSRQNPFIHSEHSCGTNRCVWRVLADLVIGGLRPWSSSSLIGICRTVDLSGLVTVPCAVRESTIPRSRWNGTTKTTYNYKWFL